MPELIEALSRYMQKEAGNIERLTIGGKLKGERQTVEVLSEDNSAKPEMSL
jgi:hypothetical protein